MVQKTGWFSAEETFLIITNVENKLLNIFVQKILHILDE